MNIERKAIEERYSDEKGFYGHIILDKLAIPETVRVTVSGKPFIPESFDLFGFPNFTEEQKNLFMFESEEIRREQKNNGEPLMAEVVYEERIFDVPKDTFDTIEGIEKSLINLSSLNKMLENRRIFSRFCKNGKLNDFILFGYFHLDRFGQITSVDMATKNSLKKEGDVEYFEAFYKRNDVAFFMWIGDYGVPVDGTVCPCCGKRFTIDDVKNNPCTFNNGKYYHRTCWNNYKKLQRRYIESTVHSRFD